MLTAAGRVILVTGANRGIGKSIALKLIISGFHVVLGARSVDALQPMVTIDPKRVMGCPLDVTDSESCTAFIQSAVERFHRIDGLINNAGIFKEFTPSEGDDAELDLMWQTNCVGPARLIRLTMPYLRTSGIGRIVNLSSLSGKRVTSPATTGYCMTKHAVMALTHGARKDGFADGVRAIAICPGLTRTDMAEDVLKVLDTGKGHVDITDPTDIAEMVHLALTLPNRASITEMAVNWRCEDLV